MTTFTVTTLDDIVGADGQRSLREAVNAANASPDADTIVFAPGLEGHTLTLTQGELLLTQDVTIDGDANNDGTRLTISGNDASRILHVTGAATDVSLRDITLTHGDAAGYGGAVLLAAGRLAVTNSTLTDNRADGGGAIAAYHGTALTVRGTELSDNHGYRYLDPGAGAIWNDGTLVLEDSVLRHNQGLGGGALLNTGTAYIARTSIVDNTSDTGGGINSSGNLTVESSTISGNHATGHVDGFPGEYYGSSGRGGGIYEIGGTLTLRNSTVTGNIATTPAQFTPSSDGGGIFANSLDIANSIVAGNVANTFSDIHGAVAVSNGHNLFGSTVAGSIDGDRQNIAAGTIFATIDPTTGGGQANADGVVLLRANAGNLALGAADPFAVMPADQLGHARPQPAGSLADLGAAESSHALSTSPSAGNDLLTGTSGVNTISGLDGADRIFGGAGADTLNGNAGSDVLEGGTGNDHLNGGTGIDTAWYGGATAITADLSGATDTVVRGSETDTLTGIEGIVGSRAADTFKGDAGANWFMGGDGKDLYTGGGGRDTFDFNTVNDSRVGASARDVITDFTHGTDKIDLSGIDADTTKPGDQAFHWVGSAAFTGAPGELGFFTSGANTVIQASNDGDATGELQIQLTGHPTLSASDFYL